MSNIIDLSEAAVTKSGEGKYTFGRQLQTSAEWSELPNLLVTSRFVGATIDSHRFVVVEAGCFSEGNVLLYDNRLPFSWKSLPASPMKECCDAVAVNGNLVLIGMGGSDANKVHILDLSTLTWSQLPSPRTFRDCCSIVFLGDYLYAFGGFQYTYHPGRGLGYGRSTTPISSVERLNMKTMQWEDVCHMSTKRGYCAVATLDDKIFVIGGSRHNWGVGLGLVEILDTKSLTWSSCPPTPIGAFACAAVSLGENVIITGGIRRFHENKSLGTTQVYNSSSKVWSVAKTNMITPRAWHAAGLLGKGQLIVAGGEKVCGASHKCYSPQFYDTVEEVILCSGWKTLGPLIMLRWLTQRNRANVDTEGVKSESDLAVRKLVSDKCPEDVFRMVCNFL